MHLYERNWATSQNVSFASYVPNWELQELNPELMHVSIEEQNIA